MVLKYAILEKVKYVFSENRIPRYVHSAISINIPNCLIAPTRSRSCADILGSILLRAPTHQSFTLNSRFLSELKYKAHPSKSVHNFFYFRFCLIFIKVYSFVQEKSWTL